MAAKHIKADGSEATIQPKGDKFSLEELQGLVGGYIEIVHLSTKMLMVVDEEGKLKDKPLNLLATKLVRAKGYNDYIVGDVLIVPSMLID